MSRKKNAETTGTVDSITTEATSTIEQTATTEENANSATAENKPTSKRKHTSNTLFTVKSTKSGDLTYSISPDITAIEFCSLLLTLDAFLKEYVISEGVNYSKNPPPS